MLGKKAKKITINTDVGKIVTTAEITIPFGYDYKPIYEEHTQELFNFISKWLPDKKAIVEIRWEETSVVLSAKIDYLYEAIYLFGYGMKMVDDWILQAVSNCAQEKFDMIQDVTGNLNIN